ncbi:MAG TPA: MarR family transcriptional regulator [Polyangiaceae bacterium]|jgi:DNA-binding MarR family transcriptional regulator
MTTRAKAKNSAKKIAKKGGAEEPDYLRLDEQLCFPIYLAARLVVNAYRPLLDDLELTYPQYLVLLVLWETDGLSVGALGERLYLDTGTLTPLLKRMEKQGLIARRRNGDDDRVVENWLTPPAKSLKKRAQKVPVELLCNAGLELDEVRSIKEVVEGFVKKLLPLQATEAP